MTPLSISAIFILLCSIAFYKRLNFGQRNLVNFSIMFEVLVVITQFFSRFYSPTNNLENLLWNKDSVQSGIYFFQIIVITFSLISLIPSTRKIAEHKKEMTSTDKVANAFIFRNLNTSAINFISLIIFLSCMLVRNVTLLFHRSEYIPVKWSHSLPILLTSYMSYSCIILLSMSMFQNRNSNKVGTVFSLILWEFYELSLSSRGALFIPILILIVAKLFNEKINIFKTLSTMMLLIFIYLYILESRTANFFGLENFFSISTLLSIFHTSNWLLMIQNIATGPNIAGVTLNTLNSNVQNFLLSINPLPSTFVHWYSVSSSLRVNSFIPTSGLGEIATLGKLSFVLFYIILAITFRVTLNSEIFRNQNITSYRLFLQLEIYGILFLMLEYNLRSAMRFFWIYMLTFLILKELNKRDSRRKLSPDILYNGKPNVFEK